MPMPKSIAVFCGSKPGADPRHMATARSLGAAMAARGIELIYGGGRVGLMGGVADGVRDGGGKVTGIIPAFLMKREIGDTAGKLEVTQTMHERKQRMFELADGFVSLAGGIGTLDETADILSWKQLGLHKKPIILLSEDGYWRAFEAMIADFLGAGFANPTDGDLYNVVDSVDAVFDIFETIDWSIAVEVPDVL